jgi:hypothetical protein
MSDSSSVVLHPKLAIMQYFDIGANAPNSLRKFMRVLGTLVQTSVKSMTLTAPPGSPADGDTYIPLATASGAWAGKENFIAVWSTQIATDDTNTKVPAWEFYAPFVGWEIYNAADDKKYVYTTGNVWDTLSAHVGP